MFKRLSLATTLTALGLIVLSALGASGVTATEPTPEAETLLRGRGVLHAEGNGVAAVRGNVDLQVSADRGILLVKDEGGDARIHVEGEGGTAEFHGFTAYFGAGQATIHGKVAVVVIGNNINLDAAGRGWAFLKGRGTFIVNGRGPFPWTPEGVFASVAPAQP